MSATSFALSNALEADIYYDDFLQEFGADPADKKDKKKKKNEDLHYEEEYGDLFSMRSAEDIKEHNLTLGRLRSGVLHEANRRGEVVGIEFDKIMQSRFRIYLKTEDVFKKMVGALKRYKELSDKHVKSSSASTKPFPVAATVAIKTTVNVMLLLITTLQSTSPESPILGSVLEILANSISDVPALSLVDGPAFHPSISDSIKGLTDFVKGVFDSPKTDAVSESNRIIAARILFGITLARGSLIELLSMINILLASKENRKFKANSILTSIADLVVEEPEAVLVASDTKKYCTNKHELKLFKTPNTTYECDLCRSTHPKNADMAGCRDCNYDLCMDCYNIPNEPTEEDKKNFELQKSMKSDNKSEETKHEKEQKGNFPTGWKSAINTFAPTALKDDMQDFNTVCLVLLSQLQRLTSTYQPGSSASASATLYVPLRIEVKPRTFVELLQVLNTLGPLFYGGSKDDKEWRMKMSMLSSALSVLRAHLYQFIASKQSYADLKLEDATIQGIRTMVYGLAQSIASDCASATVHGVIRDVAASIVDTCFSFFVATPSQQCSSLTSLLEQASAADSKTQTQGQRDFAEKMLPNTLRCVSTNRAMHSLLSELGGKLNDNVLSMLSGMLKHCVLADLNTLTAGISPSANDQRVLAGLIKMQRALLVMGPGESATAYCSELVSAAADIVTKANAVLSASKNVEKDAVRVFGEILPMGVVGSLLRPALLKMTQVAGDKKMPKSGGLSYLHAPAILVPKITELFALFQSTSSLCEKALGDSRLPYATSRNYEFFPYLFVEQSTFNNATKPKSLTISRKFKIQDAESIVLTFDSDICHTRGDTVEVLNDKKSASPVMSGARRSPQWKNVLPVTVQGDSFDIQWKGKFTNTDGDLEERGMSFRAVAQCVGQPTQWVTSTAKTLIWLAGAWSSHLIQGSQPSSDEKQVLGQKDNIFGGGLKLHDNKVSKPFSSGDLASAEKKPDLKVNDETNFLTNLLSPAEESKLEPEVTQLIAKLEKFAPDRIRLLKSITAIALRTRRVVFATLLNHTKHLKIALADAESPPDVAPNDTILKIWSQCAFVKRLILNAKTKGGDFKAVAASIDKRMNFLKRLYPVMTRDENANSEEEAAMSDALPLTRAPSLSHTYSQYVTNVSSGAPNVTDAKKAWAKAKAVSSMIHQSMQVVKRLDHLMRAQRNRADAVNDTTKTTRIVTNLLEFLTGEAEVDLEAVERGLIDQRTRGLMRLAGLRHFLKIATMTSDAEMLCIMLRHLAQVFVGSGEYNPDAAKPEGTNELPNHFHSFLDSVSFGIKDGIAFTYFEVVERLLALLRESDQKRVATVQEREKVKPKPSFKSVLAYHAAADGKTGKAGVFEADLRLAATETKVKHEALGGDVFAVDLSDMSAFISVAGDDSKQLNVTTRFSVEARVLFDAIDDDVENNAIVSKMGPIDEGESKSRPSSADGAFAVAVNNSIWVYEDFGSVNEPKYKLQTNNNTIRCVLLLPDGDTIITGGEDDRMCVFSLESKQKIFERAFGNTVTNVVYGGLQDGEEVIFVSADKEGYMLSTTDNKFAEKQVYRGHTGMLWGLDIMKEENWIVLGSYDDSARVFDITSGECKLTYRGHSEDINCVLALGGGLVASGCDDRTVKIWKASDGSTLKTLTGHTGYVMVLCQTMIDNVIASGSRDHKVKVWNYDSGECLYTLDGHINYIKKVSLMPDGKLISGSSDNTFKIWELSETEGKLISSTDTCNTCTAATGLATPASSIGWELRATAGGPEFILNGRRVGGGKAGKNPTLKAGIWYTLGCDFNGEEIKTYVNGIVASERKWTVSKASDMVPFDGPLTIGCNAYAKEKKSSAIHLQDVRIMQFPFCPCASDKCERMSMPGYNMCQPHLSGIEVKPDMLRLLTYSICSIDANFSYLPLFVSKGVVDAVSSDVMFPGAKFLEQKISAEDTKKIVKSSILQSTLPQDCRSSAWALFRMIAYSFSQADASVATMAHIVLHELERTWLQREEVAAMKSPLAVVDTGPKEPEIFKEINTVKASSSNFGTLDTSNRIFLVTFKFSDEYSDAPFIHESTFMVKPHGQGVTLSVRLREFDDNAQKFCSDTLYSGPEQKFTGDTMQNFVQEFETPVQLEPGKFYGIYLYCHDGATNTGTCPTGTMGMGIRSLYSSGDAIDTGMSTLGGADVALIMKFHDGGVVGGAGGSSATEHTKLLSASSQWHKNAYNVTEPPNVGQIEIFAGQLLWLLLRVRPHKQAVRTIKQQKYVQMLLSCSLKATNKTTSLLSFRLLGDVVKSMQPNEPIFDQLDYTIDDTSTEKKGNSFVQTIMTHIGRYCFPGGDLSSHLLANSVDKMEMRKEPKVVRDHISLMRELLSSESWSKQINTVLLQCVSELSHVKDSFSAIVMAIEDSVGVDDAKGDSTKSFKALDADTATAVTLFADSLASKAMAALCVLAGQYELIEEGSLVEINVDGETQRGMVISVDAKKRKTDVYSLVDGRVHNYLKDARENIHVVTFPKLNVDQLSNLEEIISVLTAFISSNDPVIIKGTVFHPSLLGLQIVFNELKGKAYLVLMDLFAQHPKALAQFIAAGHGRLLTGMITGSKTTAVVDDEDAEPLPKYLRSSFDSLNQRLASFTSLISARLQPLSSVQDDDNDDVEVLKHMKKISISQSAPSLNDTKSVNAVSGPPAFARQKSDMPATALPASLPPFPAHAFLVGPSAHYFTKVPEVKQLKEGKKKQQCFDIMDGYFVKLDRDQNGKITVEELKAAIAADTDVQRLLECDSKGEGGIAGDLFASIRGNVTDFTKEAFKDFFLGRKQWNCEACTFLNEVEASVCAVCETPRNMSKLSSMWKCEHCDFQNDDARQKCRMCDRPAIDMAALNDSLAFARDFCCYSTKENKTATIKAFKAGPKGLILKGGDGLRFVETKPVEQLTMSMRFMPVGNDVKVKSDTKSQSLASVVLGNNKEGFELSLKCGSNGSIETDKFGTATLTLTVNDGKNAPTVSTTRHVIKQQKTGLLPASCRLQNVKTGMYMGLSGGFGEIAGWKASPEVDHVVVSPDTNDPQQFVHIRANADNLDYIRSYSSDQTSNTDVQTYMDGDTRFRVEYVNGDKSVVQLFRYDKPIALTVEGEDLKLTLDAANSDASHWNVIEDAPTTSFCRIKGIGRNDYLTKKTSDGVPVMAPLNIHEKNGQIWALEHYGVDEHDSIALRCMNPPGSSNDEQYFAWTNGHFGWSNKTNKESRLQLVDYKTSQNSKSSVCFKALTAEYFISHQGPSSADPSVTTLQGESSDKPEFGFLIEPVFEDALMRGTIQFETGSVPKLNVFMGSENVFSITNRSTLDLGLMTQAAKGSNVVFNIGKGFFGTISEVGLFYNMLTSAQLSGLQSKGIGYVTKIREVETAAKTLTFGPDHLPVEVQLVNGDANSKTGDSSVDYLALTTGGSVVIPHLKSKGQDSGTVVMDFKLPVLPNSNSAVPLLQFDDSNAATTSTVAVDNKGRILYGGGKFMVSRDDDDAKGMNNAEKVSSADPDAVAIGVGNSVFLYDLKTTTSSPQHELKGHTNSVVSMTLLPDGERLVSGSQDDSIIVWDLESKTQIKKIDVGDTVYSIQLAGDDAFITAQGDTIKMWDMNTYSLIRTFTGHDSTVHDIDVLPDGRIVSVSYDDVAKVWNQKTGACAYTFNKHSDDINAVIANLDDESESNPRIATASDDKTIMVWRANSGDVLHTMRGHTGYVMVLVKLAQPDLIASGSRDHDIRIWNYEDGQQICKLSGHTDYIKGLVPLHDGRLLSTCTDSTFKIWDIETQALQSSTSMTSNTYGCCATTVNAAATPMTQWLPTKLELSAHYVGLHKANESTRNHVITANKWQRLVISRKKSVTTVFLNGKKVWTVDDVKDSDVISKWGKHFFVAAVPQDEAKLGVFNAEGAQLVFERASVELKAVQMYASGDVDSKSLGAADISSTEEVDYNDLVVPYDLKTRESLHHLVKEMGFSSSWASTSLDKFHYDVRNAVAYCLTPQGQEELTKADREQTSTASLHVLNILGYSKKRAKRVLEENKSDLYATLTSMLQSEYVEPMAANIGPLQGDITMRTTEAKNGYSAILAKPSDSFLPEETNDSDDNVRAKPKESKERQKINSLVTGLFNAQSARVRLVGLRGILSLFRGVEKHSLADLSDEKNKQQLTETLSLLSRVDKSNDLISKVCRIVFHWKDADILKELKTSLNAIINAEFNLLTDATAENLTEFFPLTQRFVVEAVIHISMAVKLANVSTDGISNAKDEAEALNVDLHPSIPLALMLCQAFTDFFKARDNSALLHRMRTLLFPTPLVNLLLEVLSLRDNCVSDLDRQRSLHLVTFLAQPPARKKGERKVKEVKTKEESLFQPRQIKALTTLLNATYRAQGGKNRLVNSGGSLKVSPFFRGLLQLCLAINKAVPNSTVDAALWMQELVDIVKTIEAFGHSRSLPADFKKETWAIVVDKWKNEKKEYTTRSIARGDLSKDDAAAAELKFFDEFVGKFTLKDDQMLIELLHAYQEKRSTQVKIAQVEDMKLSEDDVVSYRGLEKYSIRALKLRLALLLTLNTNFEIILTCIDLTVPPGVSKLTDNVRAVKGLMLQSIKNKLWDKAMEETRDSSCRQVSAKIDPFKRVKMIDHKHPDTNLSRSAFGQLFREINNKNCYRINGDDARAFKVDYLGVASIDVGGPYREICDMMCEDLQSDLLPLFIPCPNNRAQVGANRETFVPNPNATRPLYLKAYEFLGKMMGVAMRTDLLLNLDFPSMVWKPLTFEKVNKEDVLGIDILSYNILNTMRSLEDNEQVAREFEENGLTFTTVGSDQQTSLLVPRGDSRKVKWEDRHMYAELIEKHRLNEFQPMCEAIQRGLATVVPYPLLSLMTEKELSLKVCGKRHIDIDFLSQNTQYEGCNANDNHIKLFWIVMRTKFEHEEHAKFLRWVWGRSRLPLPGERWSRKFKIASHSRSRNSGGNVDQYLPESHTCFFTLDLPKYTSLEIMTEKLLFAITHCVSVDGDGSLNYGGIDMNADDSSDDELGLGLFD